MRPLDIFIPVAGFAHSTESSVIHSNNPYILKWSWDPTLLLFILLTLLYCRGLYRLRANQTLAGWQKFLFFTGVLVMTLAYLPPLDSFADQLFSIHMVQHLLITMVAAPLIISGAPVFVILRGMPRKLRNFAVVPLAKNRFFKFAVKWIQRPVSAVLFYEILFWFWHIPKFYNAALLNDAIHLIEHATMAIAAMNMWRLLIDSYPMRSPLNLPVRFLFIGLMMTLDMILSAALTYSNKVWYAYDKLPMPGWWAWDRLQDQHLGGIIMWVPGSVIWLTALICTFCFFANSELIRYKDSFADSTT